MINGKPVMKTSRIQRDIETARTARLKELREQLSLHVGFIVANRFDPEFKEDVVDIAEKGERIRQLLLKQKKFRARFRYQRFHSQYGHMAKAHRAQERVLAKHRGVDVMDNKIFRVV